MPPCQVARASLLAVFFYNLSISYMFFFLQFTEVSIESVCLESDGTEIDDDYFDTLPSNEVLVLVTVGNSWQGI